LVDRLCGLLPRGEHLGDAVGLSLLRVALPSVPVPKVVQIVHGVVELAVVVEATLGVDHVVDQRADVALDDAAPAWDGTDDGTEQLGDVAIELLPLVDFVVVPFPRVVVGRLLRLREEVLEVLPELLRLLALRLELGLARDQLLEAVGRRRGGRRTVAARIGRRAFVGRQLGRRRLRQILAVSRPVRLRRGIRLRLAVLSGLRVRVFRHGAVSCSRTHESISSQAKTSASGFAAKVAGSATRPCNSGMGSEWRSLVGERRARRRATSAPLASCFGSELNCRIAAKSPCASVDDRVGASRQTSPSSSHCSQTSAPTIGTLGAPRSSINAPRSPVTPVPKGYATSGRRTRVVSGSSRSSRAISSLRYGSSPGSTVIRSRRSSASSSSSHTKS